MTPKERAESYARVFPQYPRLRYDNRWLDGFWVLGQDYRGSGLHGSYPPGFLKRLHAIFPEEFTGRVLHLFSGSLDKGVNGVRVDLKLTRQPPPDIFGDAHRLPFAGETFDLIVADPPYTPEDAKKYGTPMINRRVVLAECARVLRPGGHLIWLDTRSPMFRKDVWHWWGIIGIARSTNHLYRAVTFYQRRELTMGDVNKRIIAASEKFAAGFAILLGQDATSVAEAASEQKSNTKVRETGDDEETVPRKRGRPAGSTNKPKPPVDDDDEDEAPVAKKKGPKPPVEDDDDEDEDGEAAPKIPADDAKLLAMPRAELKALAVANKIDPGGKTREDLTKLLAAKRDGKKAKAAAVADDDEDEAPVAKKKKAAPVEDDDEDEAPVKKKKPAAAAEADDKPEDDDYPKVKTMKSDLEAFFKLNKDVLTQRGFFGGKVKKGQAPVEQTYADIMADVDLIKEAWADNIWPEIQSKNWEKMKAEAADIEDEDDDE